jgi:hypothetical protein
MVKYLEKKEEEIVFEKGVIRRYLVSEDCCSYMIEHLEKFGMVKYLEKKEEEIVFEKDVIRRYLVS